MRAPSASCSMWNRTSFSCTAGKSFTGMFTRPNVSAPLHIALAAIGGLRTDVPNRGRPRQRDRPGAPPPRDPGPLPAPSVRPQGCGGGTHMTTQRRDRPASPREAPRTDLPPTREPYDDGYFGTGEEEGVVRERE